MSDADGKKEERRNQRNQRTKMDKIMHEVGAYIRSRAAGGVGKTNETEVVSIPSSLN